MKLLSTILIIISMSLYGKAQYSLHENIGLFPTGFNLKLGEKKYSNTDLLYSGYSQGIKNNLSFNTGFIVSPGLIIANLNLKYTRKLNDKLRIGIAPMVTYSNEKDIGYSVAPQLTGILTYGRPSRFINLTYTRGIIFDQNNYEHLIENEYNSYNVVTLGSSFNISSKVSMLAQVLTEVDGYNSSYTLAMRNAFKSNQVIQLGVFIGEFTIVPLLTYSYYWGLSKPNISSRKRTSKRN